MCKPWDESDVEKKTERKNFIIRHAPTEARWWDYYGRIYSKAFAHIQAIAEGGEVYPTMEIGEPDEVDGDRVCYHRTVIVRHNRREVLAKVWIAADRVVDGRVIARAWNRRCNGVAYAAMESAGINTDAFGFNWDWK